MSIVATEAVYLDAKTSLLAFQAGQILERRLIELATEAAARSNATVVTPELLLSCVHHGLLDDLRVRLDERTKPGNSREAA